ARPAKPTALPRQTRRPRTQRPLPAVPAGTRSQAQPAAEAVKQWVGPRWEFFDLGSGPVSFPEVPSVSTQHAHRAKGDDHTLAVVRRPVISLHSGDVSSGFALLPEKRFRFFERHPL